MLNVRDFGYFNVFHSILKHNMESQSRRPQLEFCFHSYPLLS